jgi:hypothetical protein
MQSSRSLGLVLVITMRHTPILTFIKKSYLFITFICGYGKRKKNLTINYIASVIKSIKLENFQKILPIIIINRFCVISEELRY